MKLPLVARVAGGYTVTRETAGGDDLLVQGPYVSHQAVIELVRMGLDADTAVALVGRAFVQGS